MTTASARYLQRHALRVMQDPKHPLFLFVLTPDDLLDIAEVNRVGRGERGNLLGYQRPEVRKHVQNITSYLDSMQGKVLFPHAPILSLPSTVKFRRTKAQTARDDFGQLGTLFIPKPRSGAPKPGWIVDGQQRVLALSKAKARSFPVPVCAFIADDVTTQREQFLRINSAKPLPRGLVSELLPEVATALPPHLSVRRAPSALCDALNRDSRSPFYTLIKRSSMSKSQRQQAIVSDSALIKVLEESFSFPSGALFSYRNLATGQTDYARAQQLLHVYWDAIRETFPEAWGLPPTKSRLLHSVGLRALTKLMDKVMGSVDLNNRKLRDRVIRDLRPLRARCRWTQGTWPEIDMEWNELQNVPAHVRLLSNYLLRCYLGERRP